MIQVDISNIWGALSLPDLLSIEQEVAQAHAALAEGNGLLNSWADPSGPDGAELIQKILDAAQHIQNNSRVCLVLGSDISCLGARGAIELLQGPHRNLTLGTPQIFFTGSSLSSRQWQELRSLLEGKDFSVIVVSAAGISLETAIALRDLRWMLERKYGTDEASNRIYAVTNPDSGVLGQLAREEQWQIFPMGSQAPDIFSPLSPAGLLPMAVSGIPIQELLQGAAQAAESCGLRSFENPLWLYAGVRLALSRRNTSLELIESFEPGFQALGAWWQQLLCSAAGDGQSIFPAAAELPGGLYGLGHLIQAGSRNLFETLVRFDPEKPAVAISSDWKNLDGLGHLEGKNLDDLENAAFEAMVTAHTDSGIPMLTMDCGPLNAHSVGELLAFLLLCAGLSGLLLGQPPYARSGLDPYLANLAAQLQLGEP